MHRKFIVALSLAVLSMSAAAAPTYEVTFKGEAPVRITLDETRTATVMSRAYVWDVPAVQVYLTASGENDDQLWFRAQALGDLADQYKCLNSSVTLPALNTVVYSVKKPLLRSQHLEVIDRRWEPKANTKLVTVTRLE